MPSSAKIFSPFLNKDKVFYLLLAPICSCIVIITGKNNLIIGINDGSSLRFSVLIFLPGISRRIGTIGSRSLILLIVCLCQSNELCDPLV